MSLFIASLNSGSNGNCYYIGNDQEAVFIDAGLSCRDTELRMERLGLPMTRVKAIFISHEHSDHILGLQSLAAKYGLPVYLTEPTLKELRSRKLQPFARFFEAGSPVTIGSLAVLGFRKFHDACDPHSFVVSAGNTHVGVFTDIGRNCEQVIRHFGLCQAAFLESNYDEDMLMQGKYPWFLKNRIRSGNGHLSNREALELFRDKRHPGMTHLILSHLSKENNRPELVEQLFAGLASGVMTIVASRGEETLLYEILPPKASLPAPYGKQQEMPTEERSGTSGNSHAVQPAVLAQRRKSLRQSLSARPEQLRLF